jgi:hypothetical protein
VRRGFVDSSGGSLYCSGRSPAAIDHQRGAGHEREQRKPRPKFLGATAVLNYRKPTSALHLARSISPFQAPPRAAVAARWALTKLGLTAVALLPH